jgi:hypothetical protein
MNLSSCFHVRVLLCSVLIAVHACARPPKPAPDPMHTVLCDTTPMKPIGRAAQVPDALPISGLGTLTGVVVQAETGDALSHQPCRESLSLQPNQR